jgi:hypothetical protein
MAGLSATTFGLALVAAMPVAAHWRVVGAVLWLLLSTREMHCIARGFSRCQRLRIAQNGDAEVMTPDGGWVPATLCAGSIVLPRLAWLRLRADNGQHFAELLRCESPRNKDWRRLQVIWRHLGAGR